ncbi:MAG: hypothetical protein IJ318_01490 [Clostridia bacterium]|nr:hypothetical protein [Clostridia bacterium]
MIIDTAMLTTMTLEQIMQEREQAYISRLDFARQFDAENALKNAEKIAEFNKKYPCLSKPVEQLSEQQRQELATLYTNYTVNMLLASGAGKQEIAQAQEDYADASKLDNAQLEIMHGMLVAMFKPHESSYSAVANAEEEFATVYFKISKQDAENPEIIALLEQRCKTLLGQGQQVKIVVNSPMRSKNNDDQIDYLFSNETLRRLIDLNNSLHGAGMKSYIMVNEYADVIDGDMIKRSWTLKDVVVANREIDNIAKRIKEQNLSPFEAMVYIHKYITSNFAYKEGGTEECRVIPGIFKNGKIVCSGYASFVKAIVDKLDMPELKCMIVGCELYKKSLSLDMEGGHCHNLVWIKDEKYGLDGYYVEDACWDSKLPNYEQGRGFAHCLYPVGDLAHMRGMHYVQHSKGDRLSSLMFDPQEMENALTEMAKALKGEKTESAIKAYFDRRKKVKSGAEIVDRFADKSKPITMEQYIEAVKTVLVKFELCEPDKVDETAMQMMSMSSAFSRAGFDRHATSSFVTTNPNAPKIKTTNSLSANDGRNS